MRLALSLQIFAALAVTLSGFALNAQEQLPADPAAAPAAAPSGPFRKIAPGVETVVPAEIKPDELFSIETVAGQANTRVNKSAQCLELTFKPIRYVRLRLPDANGVLKDKLVWYMVYHVKQPVVEVLDAAGNPIPPKPMRFFPVFWLEDRKTKKVYPDRLIAAAIPLIQRREDPNRPLLNTVEIAGEIAPSPPGEDNSTWGVVTWDDIDLRINRFSVYVAGLSNAFKLSTEPGQEGQQVQKTLEINFWRPGDAFFEREDEIRLGAPGDVDYRWFYR